MKRHLTSALTILMVLSTIAVTILATVSFASDTIVEAYIVTADNHPKTHHGETTNFNIRCNGVRTTFNDAGYCTTLKVGEQEISITKGTGTLDGVKLETILELINGGQGVKITYKLTNTTSVSKTVGVATHADIMVDGKDSATIERVDEVNGFRMTDGKYNFNFIGGGFDTPLSTLWFGQYPNHETNKWNNSTQNKIDGVDSAMAFSWKDKVLAPNSTLSLSSGIDINVPPVVTVGSSLNDLYNPGDTVNISGMINDRNNGDIVSIYYSFDGGTAQKIEGKEYKILDGAVNYDVSFKLPNTITQRDKHYIEIWGMDDKGNNGERVKLNINIDDTPPTGSHTISPNWSRTQVTISVTATDTKSGVKQITLPNGSVVNQRTATYNVTSNGNYTFTLKDNAGNSGTYTVTVNNIDTTAPTVAVSPEVSGWTKKVNVRLDFSDDKSGFKNYQYAITNSRNNIGISSSSRSSAISRQNDVIEINTEGEKYLHIKTTDKVGNVSSEIVKGPYKIDTTPPEITIGNYSGKHINSVNIDIVAIDALSGRKRLTIKNVSTGSTSEIINGTYNFTKNGQYQLVAIDNADNEAKVNFTIDNIYKECGAGLDHPPYKENLNSCPICNTYSGLSVTENSCTYDRTEHRVKYNNPKNARIVEYYNGSTTKPKAAGTYNYELKVIYEGNESQTGVARGEYKTGASGIYTINKRTLTIDNIVAVSRTYDKNNYEIAIQGGILHNLLTNNPDNIGFKLNGAYVENNQAGKQTVKIREVQLTNNQNQNYILTQPAYIQVDITKDQLTIAGITAKNRQYDGTTSVELQGGTLSGIQKGDNVSFNLPATGNTESKNIGEHKVQVPVITLAGDQANNYYLVQPTYGTVKATITSRVLTIDGITATSPVYNKENTEIRIQNGVLHNLLENNPDNIGFTLQGAYVENNNAGEQVVKIREVLLTNNDLGNYTLTQPEDISVEIRAKELTIIDIVAKDRIYDGTKIVELSGGKLVGVCYGDKVRFNMPETGEIENKNVGSWKVAIDTISLEGEDIANYVIKQPEYGTVMAEITQRPLKVIELAGKNKIYDGNKTVEIIGGKLDGYIENDDVVPQIPQNGETESEKVGTWNVSIEPITLSGEDVPNYKFTQPEEGEIKATISTESGQLKIGCEDKIYDRKVIEPYVIEKNSTAEVEYTYYKSGTDEKVEQPYDVGVYDVIGYIPTDGNYTEANSNKVTFKIKNPEEPLLQLKSKIISVNNKEISAEEKFKVNYRDEIEVEIEIDNSGKGNGYAQKVITRLPEGIELAKDNEINKQNGWEESEKGIIETTKLSLENNINNEIFSSKENTEIKEENSDSTKDPEKEEDSNVSENPEDIDERPEIPEGFEEGEEKAELPGDFEEAEEKQHETTKKPKEDSEQKEKITKQTLKLVLKVTDTSKQEKDITINNEVVQQNIRGDVVPYTNGTQDKGKSQNSVQLEYLDFEVEKKIVKIIETDTSTGAKKTYDIQQKPKQIIKIDLKSSKIGHTKLEVVYQINVTNKGNKAGKIDKIVDILPAGVDFKVAENQGWSIDKQGNISYSQMSEEIKPNETKQVELKLNWNVTSGNMSARTNYAMVQSSEELDEILVKENRAVITQTNNYNGSEMIVSIVTGQMVALWLTLTGVCIAVIAGGVALIKKYVVFK